MFDGNRRHTKSTNDGRDEGGHSSPDKLESVSIEFALNQVGLQNAPLIEAPADDNSSFSPYKRIEEEAVRLGCLKKRISPIGAPMSRSMPMALETPMNF
jgi:hypothetical protein